MAHFIKDVTSEWWFIIGGDELKRKIIDMPAIAYRKYWLARNLQDPYEDGSVYAAIIEFPEEVGGDWINRYFGDPISGHIDCRCKAVNALNIIRGFQYTDATGESIIIQLEDIRDYFPEKHCCLDNFNL